MQSFCSMGPREATKSKLIVFHQDVPFWGKSRNCHIQLCVALKTVTAAGPAAAVSHSNKFKPGAMHGIKQASGSQPDLRPYIFFFTNHVSTIIIDLLCAIFEIV